MASLPDLLAEHQLALHQLIDAQHDILREALASTLARQSAPKLCEIGEGLANFPEQSAQPLLPEDVDPLPPIMPELLAPAGEFSQENLGPILETGEEADQKRCVDANRVRDSKISTAVSSTNTIPHKAFNVDNKQKILYRLDCVAGICVLVNSIFMAIELEFEGRFNGQALNVEAAPVTDPSWFFSICDNVFAVLYFLELMCRIYIERGAFFKTCVNWFDIFLATISCLDVWILRPMALSGGAMDQMILLRLARAVKSMRAIRMVRTLRLFRGLRVLVHACYSFLPSLCWSMVLLAIFMIMGALMLGNLLQEFIADVSQDADTREWIWQHYGTALRSMYTLYEITFAGNWPTYARPVIEGVSSYFAVFFLLYITLIVFAVIRVITAIFLKDTLDAASNDAEHLVVERLQKKAQYVKKLESIFRALDTTGDGMITQTRMSELFNVPEVKAYFQTLEVEVHEGAALFHILDNGDGEVTLEEFIDGILRCKGPARAIDQVVMQADLTHLHDKLSDVIKILEEVHQTPRHQARPQLIRRGSVAEHLRCFRMDAGEEIFTHALSNRPSQL